MWSQLLPRCVGGTIIDADDPLSRATPIVGFELTRTHIYLLTPSWKFGGDRHLQRKPSTRAAVKIHENRPKRAN